MREVKTKKTIKADSEAVKLREEYEAKLSKVDDKKRKLKEQIDAI